MPPEERGPTDDSPPTVVPPLPAPRGTGSQRALQPSAPRNTGSQRALQPNPAVRSSGSHQAHQPQTEPSLKDTTPATRSPLAPPAGDAGPRASNPNLRRASNPGMAAVPAAGPRASSPGVRRVSNPNLPRTGNTGASAAHVPHGDIGAAPTSPGLGRATARAAEPSTDVGVAPKPPKKKSGRLLAFALLMLLVFGAGAVWVVLHPERFPATRPPPAVATAVQPPAAQPGPPVPAPEAKAAEPAAAKPAAPEGDSDNGELAAPTPAAAPSEKPEPEAKATEPEAKATEPEAKATEPKKAPEPKGAKKVRRGHTETATAEEKPEAAPAPKPERPAPTAQQLKEGVARCDALLSKREAIHGPDPVMREFVDKLTAEVAGAESDDQRRAAGTHLADLQRRLSR